MCGIAGFAGHDRERIERMAAALKHRGPDGNAVWVGEQASLGHARLAILDPRPEGNQPMWNADKTMAIVFNGEIYNFKELREEERLKCTTNTDTEVILKMYERHGTSFIHRLRGMFAFGIYDSHDHSWCLARDHKGIKPLFVAYPEGRLAFASEMRALMHAMPSKPSLNMSALSQYMRLQYVPGPQTLCEGIEQLPPGTILTWQNGKEERKKFLPQEAHAHFNTKTEFMSEFPAIMDESVEAHLVSDKPVGIFLSGGIDSSIVLHHMSKHAAQPIKTFTVRFDATDEEGAQRFNTDADLAQKTAEHYGTDHTEVLLSAESFKDLYRDTARSLDQPNANSVAVAQATLAHEAKKSVDVVLSGAGGDELFGGYPRYRIARILRLLRPIPGPLRSVIGSLTGTQSDVLGLQPGAVLAERLLARPADEGASVARGQWFDPNATTQLFGKRFSHLESYDSLRAFMEFDRRLWLVDEALRLADATTMQSGLECRVPFVDEKIVAAAHATKSRWHVTTHRTKALLKDTYRPILPEHLYTLSKASFFPPLAKWIRRESAGLVEEMLVHPRINELFDTARIRTLSEAHNNHTGYHLHLLSSLIQLSHWFDTVYDA